MCYKYTLYNYAGGVERKEALKIHPHLETQRARKAQQS